METGNTPKRLQPNHRAEYNQITLMRLQRSQKNLYQIDIN